MKTLTVRKEAESDISDAYNWYENKSVGLGENFVQSVEETFSRISFNPLIYPSVHKKVRRAFTRQFPFGVFYSSSNNEILVIAVMHVRKEPERWQIRT